MPRVPPWFFAGAGAVGAGVAIVYLLTGGKIVAEVPQASQVMGPAFAEKSSFDVDPSWHASPARDAVVAYLPPGSDGPLLGRIVALPGDRLEVRERRLLVNGTIIKKTSRSMSDETVPEIVCPRECVYVLVDSHAPGAKDSAALGPLPLWRVMGSVSP